MKQIFHGIATLGILAVLGASPAHLTEDQARNSQWHLKYLKIDEAHHQTKGGGVLIALIDTGVIGNHPDLQMNISPGTDLIGGGNGNGLGDADGHGTAMAGLIVAHGHDGGSGALGIAPAARVVSLRDSTPVAGHGTVAELARGIDWAIGAGVQVISISTGGGSSDELFNAVARARAADIVIVAAVGNRPKAIGVETPASYPGVLAAAAVDRNGNHHAVSVTGPEVVLAAPGVDIVSTDKNGGYSSGTGTSGATAIIAGAAALVRAKYPDLSAEDVIHRLTATAIDKGPPGRDEQYGYGVLNIVGALTADIPPRKPRVTPSSKATTPTTSAVADDGKRATGIGTGWVIVLVALAAAVLLMLILAHRRRRTGG